MNFETKVILTTFNNLYVQILFNSMKIEIQLLITVFYMSDLWETTLVRVCFGQAR